MSLEFEAIVSVDTLVPEAVTWGLFMSYPKAQPVSGHSDT